MPYKLFRYINALACTVQHVLMHIELCMHAFYLHLCTSELESVKIISIDACCNEIHFSILTEHDCSVHIYVYPCKCAYIFMYMCMFLDECMLIHTFRFNQYNLPLLIFSYFDNQNLFDSIVNPLREGHFSF